MLRFIVLVLLLAVSVKADEVEEKEKSNARQKRLLFYDEEGNLVKTYTNPYLRGFEKIPIFGNFMSPFTNFFKPPQSLNNPSTYMIPVSEDVVQQIENDSTYQNKLQLMPASTVVESNPLCSGKRSQIPSPRSCNTFLNCWDGWAFEQQCPDGLLFSNQGYCDYPSNVDCTSRRTSAEGSDPQPRCSKEFETFRNELKCSEFFVCVNSFPFKFKCPADLSFSQKLGVCDYPNRVECGMSLGIATDSPPSQQGSPSSPMNSGVEPQPSIPAMPTLPALDSNVITMKNSLFNSQTWASTHVAMSRQDAIRQLNLGRIAKLDVSN